MANGKFVSYLRVSTGRQGRSGLGLDAQRKAVADYLNGGDWRLVAEVVEVETGKREDWPKLAEALALCRLHNAALIIGKLDRLARNTRFLLSIVEGTGEAGVVFCDLPSVPAGPVGKFIVTQMAAVAELEGGLISQRTKAALEAAKARGRKLGGNRGVKLAPAAQEAGRAAQAARSQARAADLAPVLRALREAGVTSLGGIARALKDRGIPTARGGSEWTPVQVSRVLDRLAA